MIPHPGCGSPPLSLPCYIVVCQCPKAFTSDQELKRHIGQRHSDLCLPCPQCGKSYTSQRNLNRHLTNFHVAPIPCPICGKLFKKALMPQHFKWVHSGDLVRDKVCPYPHCGKAYKTIDHLKRHQKEKGHFVS